MIYSFLILLAISTLIFWYKRWQKIPEAERRQFTRASLLWGAAIAIFGLVLTGRAHWLMGALAALLAIAGRLVQLAQFVPLFKKIFGDEAHAERPASGRQKAPANQQMTRQQAADILGVKVNASAEEIRLAHKKLMQKIHPDRGGTDALAKQINQAKDVLLK